MLSIFRTQRDTWKRDPMQGWSYPVTNCDLGQIGYEFLNGTHNLESVAIGAVYDKSFNLKFEFIFGNIKNKTLFDSIIKNIDCKIDSLLHENDLYGIEVADKEILNLLEKLQKNNFISPSLSADIKQAISNHSNEFTVTLNDMRQLSIQKEKEDAEYESLYGDANRRNKVENDQIVKKINMIIDSVLDYDTYHDFENQLLNFTEEEKNKLQGCMWKNLSKRMFLIDANEANNKLLLIQKFTNMTVIMKNLNIVTNGNNYDLFDMINQHKVQLNLMIDKNSATEDRDRRFVFK